jgi:hypothetical protein
MRQQHHCENMGTLLFKTWSGFWKHVFKEVEETSSLYIVHMQLLILNIEIYFHAILLYYSTKLCVSVQHNICTNECLLLCFSVFNVLFYGVSYRFQYCTFSVSCTFRCFEKKMFHMSPFSGISDGILSEISSDRKVQVWSCASECCFYYAVPRSSFSGTSEVSVDSVLCILYFIQLL